MHTNKNVTVTPLSTQSRKTEKLVKHSQPTWWSQERRIEKINLINIRIHRSQEGRGLGIKKYRETRIYDGELFNVDTNLPNPLSWLPTQNCVEIEAIFPTKIITIPASYDLLLSWVASQPFASIKAKYTSITIPHGNSPIRYMFVVRCCPSETPHFFLFSRGQPWQVGWGCGKDRPELLTTYRWTPSKKDKNERPEEDF